MRVTDGSAPELNDTSSSKVQGALPVEPVQKQVAAPAPLDAPDVVTLGEGSELIQLTLQVGAAHREAEVDQVRRQLSAGDYRVSAQELSRAIVDDLLTKSQSGAR
jgi:hypothetical protein